MTGRDRRVAIVGAGVGGLAAAIHLAARGCAVSVFEAAPAPGGKLRAVELGGVAMDAGPTLLTLRPVFEALFALAGTRLDAHLALTEAHTLGRHVWPDGATLDLHRDEARSADAIGDFAGAAEARGYRDFMARARQVRGALDAAFLQRARPTALGLAAELGMARLLGLSPFARLDDALGQHFRDARLRQLFGGHATYVGASPLQAPATLMMVAAVEQEGVWRVAGGVHRLAAALARVAEGMGVTLRCRCPVERVLVAGGRAAGLRLADGTEVAADAVVMNADVAALGAGLFGVTGAVDAVPPRRRSFSAVTWLLRGRIAGRGALHSNVVFPPPGGEYAALGFRGRLPEASTLHLTALDRGDDPAPRGGEPSAPRGGASPAPRGGASPAPRGGASPAPRGGDEGFQLSMSAPARGAAAVPDLAALTASRLAQLERAGFALEATHTHATTPGDYDALFPGTGGALYGPAMQGWNAAFERPRAATRLPGLFLAGGGTHPGAGLAMAALSGRFAAEAILEER